MLRLVLATLLSTTPIGSSVRHRVGPVSFELPASWRQTSRNGTVQFDSPDGDAYLLIDVSTVQREGLTADACLDLVLKRLAAGPSWEKKKTLDPAFAFAHESLFERSPNLANQARVDRFVGCDGHFVWSMVFFAEAENYTYYGYVTTHVEDTLRSTGLQPNSPEARLLQDAVRDAPQATPPPVAGPSAP